MSRVIIDKRSPWDSGWRTMRRVEIEKEPLFRRVLKHKWKILVAILILDTTTWFLGFEFMSSDEYWSLVNKVAEAIRH